jgi:hypothetical protein
MGDGPPVGDEGLDDCVVVEVACRHRAPSNVPPAGRGSKPRLAPVGRRAPEGDARASLPDTSARAIIGL